MAEFDEERLKLVLRSLADHLVVDEGPVGHDTHQRRTHQRPTHQRRTHQRRGRRGLTTAAAAVAVLVMALLVAPVRNAVAEWLSIGQTSVRLTPDGQGDPIGLPAFTGGLRTISQEAAETELGRSLPNVAATPLGQPGRLVVPPEGGVILVWSNGATTLWVHKSEVDVDILLAKLIDAEDRVRAVDNLGDAALLIEGDHVLATPNRRLAAGSVLLWSEGALEYRFESNLDPDELIELARDL